MSAQLAWALAIGLIVVGFIGVVLPGVPGVIAIFGGMLLGAWAGDFQRISVGTVVLLGALTALAFVIDFVAALLGAKRVGASRLALLGAAIGAMVGLFFGILGLVFGPFAGAVVGELLARRQLEQAAKVGVGTWLGLMIGTLAKLALAGAMLAVFTGAYWVN